MSMPATAEAAGPAPAQPINLTELPVGTIITVTTPDGQLTLKLLSPGQGCVRVQGRPVYSTSSVRFARTDGEPVIGEGRLLHLSVQPGHSQPHQVLVRTATVSGWAA